MPLILHTPYLPFVICFHRGIIVYIEYQSVCPFVGFGSPTGEGEQHSLAGEGVEGPNSDDWTASLALCCILWVCIPKKGTPNVLWLRDPSPSTPLLPTDRKFGRIDQKGPSKKVANRQICGQIGAGFFQKGQERGRILKQYIALLCLYECIEKQDFSKILILIWLKKCIPFWYERKMLCLLRGQIFFPWAYHTLLLSK